MTISYTLKVASSRFGGFSKLLFRWKGSIYKLLYREFIVFVVLYTMLSIIYRQLLTEEQKRLYTKVAQYCNHSTDLIPVSFVLDIGFYVTLIVNRWWAQYTSIPLPDQLMCVISSNIHGKERGRILRRTLIRYANLSAVLILRSISTRVLKRVPTMDHVVEAGFMTQDERKKFECLHSDFNKYWIPCVWFTNLAAQARREGRIRDDVALRLLMDELNLYRAKCSMLFHYDWVSILLVYTQVAEQIIYPFGEDDDDFETNKLIDRNLQVSLLSVDDTYQNLPPAVKDKYWNESTAQPPYTTATAAETLKPSFLGSTFDMRMCEDTERSQPTEASPAVPRIQTSLLSRFFAAASPAISIKHLGRGIRGHPHLQRPGADGGFPSPHPSPAEDPEAVACVEEEMEDESQDSEPTTAGGHPEGNRPLEASEMQRKELPLV